MNQEYAQLAVEALRAMYEHNSKVNTSVGRTEVGPEPLTSEQVAHDLRVIYKEITNFDS